MGRIRVEVRGAREVRRALAQLAARAEAEAIAPAVRAGAEVLLAEAQEVARGTSAPFLAEKVTIDDTQPDVRGRVAIAVAFRDWVYRRRSYRAASFEFGSSRYPAKPVLRPALDAKRLEAARRIRDRVRAGIDRLTRQLGR